MADVPVGFIGPLRPDAAVAGVAGVVTIQVEHATADAQFHQFYQAQLNEVRQFAARLAAELESVRAQSLHDAEEAGDSLTQLYRTRQRLAVDFSKLANVEAQKRAINEEASALRGLLADGKLMAAQADTARARFEALAGELQKLKALEDVLQSSIARRSLREAQLSKKNEEESAVADIRKRQFQQDAINAQAQLIAHQRINALLAQSDQERLREERKVAAQEKALFESIEEAERGLLQSRQSIARTTTQLLSSQGTREALEREGSAIRGLIEDGALLESTAASAATRLQVINGELLAINAKEEELIRNLREQVILEQLLSRRLGVPSQQGPIRAGQFVAAGAVSEQAELDALARINRLILENDRELAAQRRALAQAAAAQRKADALKEAADQAAKEKAIIQGLITQFQATPLRGAEQKQVEAALRVEKLRKELAELRAAQATVNAAFQRGDITATQQAQAWAAAERRANVLQREIRELIALEDRATTSTRRLNSTMAQTFSPQRLAGSGVAGALGGGLAGGLIGGLVGASVFSGIQFLQNAFRNLAEVAIGFNARIQSARVGLSQFVKDGEGVRILSDDFLEFAANSSVGLDKLLEGARRLLAMGTAADAVLPRLKTLTAAVASVGGNTQTFDRVILAISQIGSKATLQAQDLRQLAEAGIPVYRILQEELGLTSAQVADIGRQAIDSQKGLDALERGLDKRFGAGLLLQLDTFQGRLQNLQSVASIFLGRIGERATGELQKGFEQLADILKDPGTLRAAQELGEVIGQIISDLRENILGESGGLLEFIRLLPTFVGDIEAKVAELQARISTLRLSTTEEILAGKPIIDVGLGGAVADRMAEIRAQIDAEAQKAAREGAAQAKIQIDLVAEVREVQLDAARAKVSVINKDQIDLSSLENAITDIDERKLAGSLSSTALDAINDFTDLLGKTLEGSPAASQISDHLRRVFVQALSDLGANPSEARLAAARRSLVSALSVGELLTPEQQKAILDAADALLQMGDAATDAANAQDALNAIQERNKDASAAEEKVIRDKTKSLKDLTDARKAEHDVAQTQIDDLKDQLDVQKGIQDAAENTVRAVEARNTRIADSFARQIDQQGRIVEDLQIARNAREDEWATKIDKATEAEKRNARAIKDAQLDLREQLRTQDDIIDAVEERYRGELRIRDLAVDEQNRALRAARRTFNVADLDFARQIAAARARGDKDAVESLRQRREAARIAFDESQEVARAELQTRQDAAEALKDQADAETQKARADKEDIQRNGQANIDALQRQGEVLSDNKAKIEGERDASLASFDSKIKIAQALATLLGRTKTDVTDLGKAQLAQAQADADAAKIRTDSIQTQIDAAVKADEKLQKAFERRAKPLQDELDKLADQHKANDILRTDEEDKATATENGAKRRVKALDDELKKLKEIAGFNETQRKAGEAITQEQQAAQVQATSAAAPVRERNIRGLIEAAISAQRPSVQQEVRRGIAEARRRAAAGEEGAFRDVEALLVDILNQAGLTSLTAQEIAAFLNPTVEVRGFVSVDPQVLELLSALTAQTPDLARAQSIIQRDPAILDRLVRAITGTDTLRGSDATRGALEQAIEALRLIEPTFAGLLEEALRLRGVTITGAGKVTAPTVAEAAALAENAARRENTTALDENTRKIQELIDEMTGGEERRNQERAATLLRGLFPGLNTTQTSGLNLEGTLNPAFLFSREPGNTRDLVRQRLAGELRTLLSTPEGQAQFIASFKQFREEWIAILKELGDEMFKTPVLGMNLGLGGFDMGAAPTLEPSLLDLMKEAATDAGAGAEDIGKAIEDGIKKGIEDDPVTPQNVVPDREDMAAAAHENMVVPVTTELDKIPVAAQGAGGASSGSFAAGIESGREGLIGATQRGIVAPISETLTTDLPPALIAAGLHSLGPEGLGALGRSAQATAALSAVGVSLATRVAGSMAQSLTESAPGVMDVFGQSVFDAAAHDAAVTAGLARAGAAAAQAIIGGARQTLGGPGGFSTGTFGAPTGPQSGGPITLPLAGPLTITQGFQPGPGNFEPGHKGIDLAVQPGQDVFSIADGVVIFADWQNGDKAFHKTRAGLNQGVGFGLHVQISHSVQGKRFVSVYGHLSAVSVQKGASVTKGQKIGEAGSTGFSTKPHLHIQIDELTDAGQRVSVDPTRLLRQAQQAVQAGGGGRISAGGEEIPGGSQAQSPAQAAVTLIQGLVTAVKAAGGDFDVVLDAFFAGATDLAKDRIGDFSAFAQSEMQAALDTLVLALQLIGGGSPEQLKAALQAAGVLPGGANPRAAETVMQQFMREMFPNGIPAALINGVWSGIDEEAVTRAWGDFYKKHPELVGIPQDKSLRDVQDQFAQQAAKRLRDFARTNQFVTSATGERIIDPALTRVFNELRNLPAGATIQDLLAKFADIGSDDSPLGQLVRLLREIAAQQPGLDVDALRGFLFGGPGFEPVDQVGAINQNTAALDQNTAALLGAKDLSDITVWTALLQEYRRTTALMEQTATATDETATNTGETADHTDPTKAPPIPPGVGLGAPPTTPAGPLTPEQAAAAERDRKLQDARARLAGIEGRIAQTELELEQAFGERDTESVRRLRAILQGLEGERKTAAELVETLERGDVPSAERAGQIARDEQIKARAEFTIEKYRAKLEAAQAAHDAAGIAEARRRIKAAERELEAVEKRLAEAGAPAPGAPGGPPIPPEFAGSIEELLKQITVAGQEAVEGADRTVPFIPGVSDAFERLPQPIEEVSDAMRDLVEQIEDEQRARQGLTSALDRELSRIVNIEAGNWPGGRAGGGTQPGGEGEPLAPPGGARVLVSQTFETNVYDAKDPHFVAETVRNRQVAEARQMNERVGRAVLGKGKGRA